MSDTLVDLHLDALRGRRAKNTLAAREAILRRLSDRLPLGLVYAETNQIEAWLADLSKAGRSRNTIWIYDYHVRQFFLWACTVGAPGTVDPTRTMARFSKPRGIPHPVTEDELAILLSLPEPLLTAVILAAFAGLRREEIVAARRQDVTPDVLRIPVAKGGDPGVVPTHPYLWEHVKARAPGHLVIGRRGRPLTGHWLGLYARRAFDRAGLPDVHLHRLRDRYGTLIQELYGDLRVTQECLRHASVATTEGYTLVTAPRRAEAVARLPVPRSMLL